MMRALEDLNQPSAALTRCPGTYLHILTAGMYVSACKSRFPSSRECTWTSSRAATVGPKVFFKEACVSAT